MQRKIFFINNMETLFLSPLTIIIIASIVGFFMAYGIGANDVANAMGTSVGSKAITLRQAIIIATIFEFLELSSTTDFRIPSGAK